MARGHIDRPEFDGVPDHVFVHTAYPSYSRDNGGSLDWSCWKCTSAFRMEVGSWTNKQDSGLGIYSFHRGMMIRMPGTGIGNGTPGHHTSVLVRCKHIPRSRTLVVAGTDHS